MGTKNYTRIILGLFILFVTCQFVQGQAAGWGDIEAYSTFNPPSSVEYKNQSSIDLKDYVTQVYRNRNNEVWNNSRPGSSVQSTVTITNASHNLAGFTLDGGVVTFPSNPSHEEIVLTLNYDIRSNIKYKRVWVTSEFHGGNLVFYDKEANNTWNGSVNITIKYEENRSLVPGSDYSVPSSICDGEGFRIDIKSPRLGSTYRVRAKTNEDNIIKQGSGDMTLSHSEAQQLWSAGDNKYRFIITEKRSGGFEVIDPEQVGRVERLNPSTGTISGETEICPGDNEQVYEVASTGADSYWWSCSRCTMESTNGNRTMRVRWDDNLTGGWIEVFARKALSEGNCDAPPRRLNVDLPDEIEYPAITGPAKICVGTTATIGLANSQSSYDYGIFKSGAEVSGAGRLAGHGGPIAWGNLGAGDYEIRLLHPQCGWYVMGGREVTYYTSNVAPTVINQGGYYCGEDTYQVQAHSSLEASGYVWYENTGGASLTEIARGDDTQELFLGNGREYHVSYIDENGCESLAQQIQYNIIDIPGTGSITGETDVCPGNNEQVYEVTGTGADSYWWSCSRCTMESTNGNRTMRVTWDDNFTSGWIEVFARKVSGGVNCDDASPTRLAVSFPNDIEYPAVTGPGEICVGTTATIGLDNSQAGYDYGIFKDGAEISGAGRLAGHGGPISWGNLGPGNYEIRLLYAGCGWYVIGGQEVTYYAPYIVPTVIDQGRHYCGEDTYQVQADSPLEAGGYIWYENTGGAALTEIARGDDTQELFLGDGREYHVSYVDDRGCESQVQQIEYNIIELPDITFESEPGICVNDATVNLNEFLTSNTRNGYWSGEFNTGSGSLFVDQIDEAYHDGNLEVSYLYVTNNNCSVEETMTLSINTLPKFEVEQEVLHVCVDDGSINLESNIANIDGADLQFNIAGQDVGSIVLLGGANYTTGQYDVVVTALNTGGCSDTREFTLRIDDASVIEFTQTDLTFCSYFEEIDFNVLFDGYVGDFYVNNTIVPGGVMTQGMTLWDPGNNSLRFIENSGCYQEHLFNLFIQPRIIFDVSKVPTRTCELDGDVEIAGLITPHGGELIGDFVNDGKFRAQVAGPGTYDFVYEYEINNCRYEVEFSITNHESPNVFAGPDRHVCRNDEIQDYSNQVNVPGGQWSGHVAVTPGGQFDPGRVAEDEPVIFLTYTYTNTNGCSSSDEITIFMNDLPTVDINRLSYEFCLNAGPHDLSQDANSSAISYWAENGITNNILYPRIMGAGIHTIEAREVSQDGCYHAKEIAVVIVETEELIVSGIEVCANEVAYVDLRQSVNIPNGEFSGSRAIVNDHRLEVNVDNIGLHEIEYTVLADNGCTLIGYFDVVIHELPETIVVDTNIETCHDDENVELVVLNPSLRYSYDWRDKDGQAVGSQERIFVSNIDQVYTVTATSLNNCAIVSDAITVNVNDIEGDITYSPGGDHIISGSTVSFDVNFDAQRYSWQLNDRVTKSSENPVMVYNYRDTTMNVSVLLEDEFGCRKTIERSISIVDEGGTFTMENEELETSDHLKLVTNNLTSISAYPNPLTGSSTLTLVIESLNAENLRVRVINTTSRPLVDQVHELIVGENQVQVNVPSEMVPGVYFVQLTSPSIKKVLALLKQ